MILIRLEVIAAIVRPVLIALREVLPYGIDRVTDGLGYAVRYHRTTADRRTAVA